MSWYFNPGITQTSVPISYILDGENAYTDLKTPYSYFKSKRVFYFAQSVFVIIGISLMMVSLSDEEVQFSSFG